MTDLSTDRAGLRRLRPYVLPTLFGVFVVNYWLPFYAASLWEDEALTWWLTKDGMGVIVERCFGWLAPGQWHPLYFLVLRAFTAILGDGEMALRLPSLLASIGCAVALVSIGKEIRDRELGWIAAFLYAAEYTVREQATYTRPYPLALFLACWSAYLVLRWSRTGGTKPLLGAAAMTAALPHVHVMFTLVAPALALHVAWTWLADRPRRRGWPVLVAALISSAGCLLYLPVLDSGPKESPLFLDWIPHPSTGAPFHSWSWPPAVIGLLAGFVILLAARAQPARVTVERRVLAFLVAWGLLPAATLYLAAEAGFTSMYLPRYYLVGVPGLCLLYALLVRALQPQRARVAAVAVAAAVAFVTFPNDHDQRHVENLRGAAETVHAFSEGRELPVFNPSFLIEARHPEWLGDPERREYVAAPLSYYDVGTPLVVLPKWLADEPYGGPELEELVRRHVAGVDRAAGIEVYGNGGLVWLARIMHDEGFALTPLQLESVHVALFVRREPAGGPG